VSGQDKVSKLQSELDRCAKELAARQRAAGDIMGRESLGRESLGGGGYGGGCYGGGGDDTEVRRCRLTLSNPR
jgi:hypothetical protein